MLLRQAAFLPAEAPPTIWAASRRGQLSVAELVDGYRVECAPVRDLLVDYLHERAAGMDYTSLRQLATKLVLLFWRDLELHEPGIDSLHLSDPVARRWKQRLSQVRHGTHRVGQSREDVWSILGAVRSFYADLTHWALEDPARWGPWAAPSPVGSRTCSGSASTAPGPGPGCTSAPASWHRCCPRSSPRPKQAGDGRAPSWTRLAPSPRVSTSRSRDEHCAARTRPLTPDAVPGADPE